MACPWQHYSHPFSNAPCTARLHGHARHVLQDLAQGDSHRVATARNSLTGLKTTTSFPKSCCKHTINLPCVACAGVAGVGGHIAAAVEGCVLPNRQVIICSGMPSLCDYLQFCNMSETCCSLGASDEHFAEAFSFI